MTRPVAINDIEELRRVVLLGHREFAILLNGGLISRKTIRLGSKAGVGRVWVIENQIDGSRQKLTDMELWTDSNVGEALDKNALLDMDPEDRPRYFTVNVTVEDEDGKVFAVWRTNAPFDRKADAVKAARRLTDDAALAFDRMDE